MKKYLLSTMILFSFCIHAEESSELDPCNSMAFYQPQAENFMDAAMVYEIRMKQSACSFKDKININTNQYLTILEFGFTKNGHRFKYKITTFEKGTRVTEQICESSSHYEHPEGAIWDAMEEVFSTPECGNNIVTQN